MFNIPAIQIDSLYHLMICLVASYFIGDFMIQIKIGEGSKWQALIIPIHGALVAGWSYVLCGAWKLWEIPLLVLVTHIFIDYIERIFGRENVFEFFLFQAIRLAVSILIALFIVSLQIQINLFWFAQFGLSYFKSIIFLAGFTFSIFGGNSLIGIVVKPFIPQIEKEAYKLRKGVGKGVGGLKGGGQLIGQMERFLIFLFIMIEQPTAIGFLITAKSILRFGEIKDHHQRMLAEYIIIGTMASFAYGISISYLTKYLIGIV